MKMDAIFFFEQPLWWPSILAVGAPQKFRPAVPGRAEIPLALPECNVVAFLFFSVPSSLHEKTMKKMA